VAIRTIAVIVCLVALVGGGAAVYVAHQVDVAQRQAQQQLRQISQTCDQAAATLTTIGLSIDHAATTVDGTQTTLRSASANLRTTAQTLDDTADIVNFTLPATSYQPLTGAREKFQVQAGQMRELADHLDQTNQALTQNAQDLRATSGNIAVLATQMNAVAAQLHEFAGDGPTQGSFAQLSAGFQIFAIYSITLHLLLFGIGLAIYLLTLDQPPRVASVLLSDDGVA
jgi:ABC-type transporter Mla subunit MlaD